MSVLVSILIPAHRSALTIRAALESCISQSYPNIEIIVLNTGSTDHTSDLVKEFKDERIQLHENAENKGIAAARNQLLKLAKGEFIAWLDADDVMMPERIEKQLAFFNQCPETDIVGSWIRTDNAALPEKKFPVTHTDIHSCLWFKNCMVQPSVMSRNFYVKEQIFYDENFDNIAEDYELWYRLRDTKKFANIPEYLTLYHMTTGEELEKKKAAAHFNDKLNLLWQKKWQSIKQPLSDFEKQCFVAFLYSNKRPDKATIQALKNVLKTLVNDNMEGIDHLIIKYHYLRLWRNMDWADRIGHLQYLLYLSAWQDFKKHYLI